MGTDVKYRVRILLVVAVCCLITACGFLADKGEEPTGSDNLPVSGVGKFVKTDFYCATEMVQPFVIDSLRFQERGEPWVIVEDGLFRIWFEQRRGSRASVWHCLMSIESLGEACPTFAFDYESEPVRVLRNAGAPTVIREDGTYKMWYVRNGWSGIGYAESDDGLVWEVVDDAALEPDLEGAEDSQFVRETGRIGSPSVIHHDGLYRMWYDGDLDGWRSIGYAESVDGVAWTKYPGNPVLVPDQSTWEFFHPDDPASGSVGTPYVMIYTNPVRSLYYMYYTGNLTGPLRFSWFDRRDSSIGFATSEDGIVWNKASIEQEPEESANEVNPIMNELLPLQFFPGEEGSSNAFDIFSIVDEAEPVVVGDRDIWYMWFHQVDLMNRLIAPLLPEEEGMEPENFMPATGIGLAVVTR